MKPKTKEVDLIQWKGRGVPWVARWSGEQLERDQYETVMNIDRVRRRMVLTWKQNPESELRDGAGFLWMREGPKRTGFPKFGDVSVHRQRTCMLHRKCQICGSKIPDGRPISWLMGPNQIEFVGPDGSDRGSKGTFRPAALTMSPPVCDGCVDLSRELCPHLKENNGGRMFTVLEYAVWGVSGDTSVYVREGDAQRRKMIRNILIPQDRADRPGLPDGIFNEATIAKQMVVEFVKYREVT